MIKKGKPGNCQSSCHILRGCSCPGHWMQCAPNPSCVSPARGLNFGRHGRHHRGLGCGASAHTGRCSQANSQHPNRHMCTRQIPLSFKSDEVLTQFMISIFTSHLWILHITQNYFSIEHVRQFADHLTLYRQLLIEKRQIVLQFRVWCDQDTFTLSIILRTPSSTKHLKCSKIKEHIWKESNFLRCIQTNKLCTDWPVECPTLPVQSICLSLDCTPEYLWLSQCVLEGWHPRLEWL